MARLVLVLLICLTAVVLSDATAPPERIDETSGSETASVRIGDRLFRLQIAADEASRNGGLAGVADIPADGGMLFVYPSPRRLRYYMAYCVIDIDLIFLDGDGRIVALHEMKAEAERGAGESHAAYLSRLKRYASGRPARFAIELKAGSIRRLGLRVGQLIDVE
ncbi:MAG: DUF192 domain-containing protein [Phycisphaerales bacterium]|nr:MAG: DUF192 domain-containing protein [Phycisphaerales bacterium]